MDTIKCLIVDDEIPAGKVIDRYIQDVPGLTTVAICRNAMEAVNITKSQQVDLIFLDIQMPGITGIEFVKTLNNSIPVILTTAFREYAVDGFELDVLDYLVKPISFERFFKAVCKIYKHINIPAGFTQELVNKAGDIREFRSFEETYIYVRVDKKMKQVWLKDIIFIESIGDYVKVITESEVIITYLKIGYLEKKLPSDKFIRIHRSYLVARDKVSSFTANTIEVGGKTLSLGVNYKKKVHEAFEGYGA